MDDMTTAIFTHDVTTNVTPQAGPVYVGFIAAAIAVVFFGSNFVPLKKFETGDGMFFQWILCASIWFTGLIVNAIRDFPTFYPLAMLGGFIWSVGNIMVVPIVKTIGLSQGILIWASFNLLMGWASGRYGFFGLTPEIPANSTLNYLGMGLCLLSAVVYIFIKSEIHVSVDGGAPIAASSTSIDREALLPKSSVNSGTVSILDSQQSFLERLSPIKKRLLGILMAIVSGTLYGANFIPVVYIQNRYDGASQEGLDYVFSHFCGILGTSTCFFIIYCVFMRNSPRVYPRAILPAFVSGVMWAIADAAWFMANAILSQAISFPIITTGPGIVASLWGVILFKEIKGKKNLVLLFIAFSIAIAGSIITGFSKG